MTRGAATRVVTLGCRLNALESEVIRREAMAAGVDETVVINTCAVTTEAVRQARQTVRRLRRDHPHHRIVVTGCAAQLDPASFAAMPEVDQVLGNREKLQRARLADPDQRIDVTDIMAAPEPPEHLIDGLDGRTRAFVQIQQGCDHRCTFCIIPFARGPNQSVPAAQVVEQVRRLVDNGYREVVLTGVDICSWGRDFGTGIGLGLLVRHILADVPALDRLRLSTVDPAAIDPELFCALAEEARLMPHLHLSLQAAHDLVLKRMKRRHSVAMAAEAVARARDARPGIVFGADVIAGFPTETEAMFEASLVAIAKMELTFLHVFPFSARPETPAARMPQVPLSARKARAARLRAHGDTVRSRYFESRVGARVAVLIETADNSADDPTGRGRCPDYAPVQITAGNAGSVEPGTIVDTSVTGWGSDGLIGEAVT